MRQARCQGCGAQVPMSESFSVFGRTLCRPCAEARVEEAGASATEETVRRNMDPTVCGSCGADNGAMELATVMDVPVCQACHDKLLHRPFPAWVKAAGAAVLILATWSLVGNWRFLAAYVEARRAGRLLEAGQAPEAHRLMASAATRVPENAELRRTAQIFEVHAAAAEGQYVRAYELAEKALSALRHDPGARRMLENLAVGRDMELAARAGRDEDYETACRLMDGLPSEVGKLSHIRTQTLVLHALRQASRGNSAEAWNYIRLARQHENEFPQAKALILSAEAAVAFDLKEYDTFLAKAREGMQAEPDSHTAVAAVASGVACQYALKGEEQHKAEALQLLEQARKLVGEEAIEDFREYERRILYRLESRQIISRKEYYRRFPASQPAEGEAKRDG